MGRKAPASGTGDTHAGERALFEKLVATLPGVELKGDAVLYTALNGNMFSYLSKAGVLALRLPEDERDAFLAGYKTRLCEQYGVVQKEYVEVPARLLARTGELARYFAASFAYVKTLKPKATTKSRSASKPR